MKKSSFMVVICFILCFHFGATVFAVEPGYSVTDQAIVSVKAEEAPTALVRFLEENHVTVAEHSTIELLAAKDPEGIAPNAIAVCTSTRMGTKVLEDVLLAVAKDGESQAKLNEDITAMARSISQGIHLNYEKTGFLVRGSAVRDSYYYEPLLGNFYDPWGCYFTYTKTSDNVTVSNVKLTFHSHGIRYTYPEYEFTGQEITHDVVAEKSYPVSGEMYDAVNHLPSDTLIDPAVDGAGTYGMSLEFRVTANGTLHVYNVPLMNWPVDQ
jgi:hypothetical protein